MKFSEEAIQQIIVQSSSISDRLNGSFIPKFTPPETIQARIERWCQNSAQGDWLTFAKRLSWEGLTIDEVKPYLGNVEYRGEIPKWIGILEYVLGESRTINDQSNSYLFADAPFPFEEILTPFIAFARTKITGYNDCDLISHDSRRDMELSLLRWLSHLASPILETEFTAYRATRQLMSPFAMFGQMPGVVSRKLYNNFLTEMSNKKLHDFFLEYAVLAKLMAEVTNLWIDHTAEFLQRLYNDREAIGKVLGKQFVQVTKVFPDQSDRHHYGRSVMILEFDYDTKLVYKPKNLGIEKAFFELIRHLNPYLLNQELLDLKAIETIVCDGYGWVEFVPQLPCDNSEMVKQYYERAGMLLALFYVLEGTDYHHENIIACGAYPVPIDQESLLHHRLKSFDGEGENSADRQLQHSVLRTAFLPYWHFGVDGQSFDFSGIAGEPGQKTTMRLPKWKSVNTDNMTLEYEQMTTRSYGNQVFLQDERQSAGDYTESIVAGFTKMYQFLMTHKNSLHQLSLLSGQQVRFIYRHTRVYVSVQNSSLTTKCLKDGIERSLHLELLTRPFLGDSHAEVLAGIFRDEKDAIERLDVPVLSPVSDRDDLPLDSGEVIKNCFESPSFDQVELRLKGLNNEDLQTQISLIRGAMYTRVHCPQSENDDSSIVMPELAPLPSSDLINEAVIIAKNLYRQAIWSKDGSVSWLGMVHNLEANRSQIQQLPFHLYDGVCGIALFFAASSKITQNDDFRDIALAALTNTRRGITKNCQLLIKEIGMGGGLGIGSIVYALVRISALLELSELLDDAIAASLALSKELIFADRKLDIMLGVAGTLLGLLTVYEVTYDTDVLERAVWCGEHLLQTRTMSEKGYLSWANNKGVLLTGFSHGAAGIAYALFRLYKQTKDDRFYEAARESQDYENSVFMPDVKNWPDFRYPLDNGRPQCWCSWCHGATGIGLGRLGSLGIKEDQKQWDDLEIAIETSRKRGLQEIDHLCCGNLGRVELLLSVGINLKRSKLVELARTQATQIIVRSKQEGGYGLGSEGHLQIGLFQGMAGIGYSLLRLAHPEILPSVLIWE